MTTNPVTLADLFRDDGDGRLTLDDKSPEHFDVAAGNLPNISRDAIQNAVEDELAALLDVEIVDVLCGGWHRLKALQAYKKQPSEQPDEVGFVPLAGHSIRSTHHPSIEILLDSQPLATIRFDVAVELKVEAVTLKVQGGRIVEILGGEYWASAKFGLEGHTLIQRSTRHFELPGRIRLGSGVQIPSL